MIWRLVERANCTPLQAAQELEENPEVFRVLTTASYCDAYKNRQTYDETPDDRQKHLTEPSGYMDSLVRKHKQIVMQEEIDKRVRMLQEEGRV